MKTLRSTVLLVTLAVLTLGGCALMEQSAPGRSTLRVINLVTPGLPTIEFPILRQIGVTLNGQKIMIGNGTPAYGRVVIYGRRSEPGLFEPGDQITAVRYYSAHNSQIPVVVTFYRDRELTQCIGGTGTMFGFSSGQSGSIPWDIQANQVTILEGLNWPVAIGVNYPLPITRHLNAGIEIPSAVNRGFEMEGMLAVQVTNLMHFTLGVNVEGQGVVMLAPCETYYVVFDNLMLRESRPVSVQLTASQSLPIPTVPGAEGQPVAPAFMLGKNSASCYVPTAGIMACQIIVSPQYIRR